MRYAAMMLRLITSWLGLAAMGEFAVFSAVAGEAGDWNSVGSGHGLHKDCAQQFRSFSDAVPI